MIKIPKRPKLTEEEAIQELREHFLTPLETDRTPKDFEDFEKIVKVRGAYRICTLFFILEQRYEEQLKGLRFSEIASLFPILPTPNIAIALRHLQKLGYIKKISPYRGVILYSITERLYDLIDKTIAVGD